MSNKSGAVLVLALSGALTLSQVSLALAQSADPSGTAWRPRSVYEATVNPEEGDVFAIRMHLGSVLERLEVRDVSGLTSEQGARRGQHIERLSRYRDEGIFPHNDHRPGLTPVFIDDAGRACAVGYLMIESGARELAERVAELQNYAYVPEITVPGVAQWIEGSGLSVEECALIQPSYGCWFPYPCGGGAPGGASNFAGTPREGPMPLTVRFRSLSIIGSFSWDFGDGGTSSLRHPTHTYTAPGSYTVSLTITGPINGTMTKVGYIEVLPLAEFSGTPRVGGVPLGVSFTDLSPNAPTDWSWDFGDGGTSNEQNPTHIYSVPGNYTVSLTVIQSSGPYTQTRVGYIQALPLVADFSATPRSGMVPLIASFTDLSTNSPTGWSWAFGDGSTSYEQHPTHTYAQEGSYTVTLTASNTLGSNTKTIASYIAVAPRSEQAKLLASDARTVDIFGTSVAISGGTALVGAPWDDHAGRQDAGSAYVFVHEGTSWTQEVRLQANDQDAFDSFGHSVALSGDTALIGAHGDEGGGGSWAGSAYVFTRSGPVWSQQAKLVASDGHAYNALGRSVSLSEDTALIGANIYPNFGASEPGSAYVFVRSGTTWTEQAKLVASDGAVGDYFGNSVSFSADTAVVGASGDDHAGGVDAGSAYVFARSGTSWTEQAKLVASDTDDGDFFGCSVWLAGDTALVGAFLDETGGGILHEGGGSAYVFVRNGTLWTQQAKLVASDAGYQDFFGCSVSLSGDRAVFGAYGDSSGAGSAYAFVRGGTSWTQMGKLRPSGPSSYNSYAFFGSCVSLSGESVVVGAPRDDEEALDAGAAYVFCLPPQASATFRNAGSNPASYSATAPLLGGTFTGTVDLTTTGHDYALLFGFETPVERTLGGGQVLLCAPLRGAGRVLDRSGSPGPPALVLGGSGLIHPSPQPGPLAVFSLALPNDPALCGLTLCTQALHFGGATPFVLSNAQDLVLGF